MPYEDLLCRFVQMSRRVLGENLVGIYLHGSAAMGCFNPEKSDLDVIVIVQSAVEQAQRLEFMQQLVRLNEQAPEKGFEMSIVRREFCDPFVYPTPFELHFSNSHLDSFRSDPEAYVTRKLGGDKDLAAHFTIINHYGKVLYGPSVQDVFGPVPKADYIDSIWYDVENACEDILENPIYMTLNLCRVLACLQDDQILSKKTGGAWGLKNLPQQYCPIVAAALECYESDQQMEIPEQDAAAFARFMLEQIGRYRAE